MRWILFCLFVALAASESMNYEPTLDPQKTYEYKYEGVVNIGQDTPGLAESGVKLQCNFKIIGVSIQTFLFQITKVSFEEFNGIPGEDSFKVSPHLTKHLATVLTKPFTFEYSKGQVIDIKTAPDVSNTIVNIVRGILKFLHVTVKTTQQIYELDEVGIHGICHSAYVIEENAADNELYVTQSIDIKNCHQKAEIYQGMALAQESKMSRERGENVVATVKYAYTIKSVGSGGLITKASAQERHYFSPFNVKGGNSKLKAIWNIELLKQSAIAGKPVTGQVKSRGNLIYKAEKGLGPMPILMISLTDPAPRIADLVKSLAQAHIYQVDADKSADVLELIQLLRATSHEDLELLWKQLSVNDEHRRWFLDTVVEVPDGRILKFLKNRFNAGDISANEAGQAVLVAFNHLSAESDLVEMAKEFLTIPFSKSHVMLWNTVILSYSSLVYRLCDSVNPCPVLAVQPLLDMATNGLTKGIDEDMVIALKALGNAGHPLSLKTIMKFLPGFSFKADSLPTRVQSVAVQTLRHLAIRDPHNVQDIVLTIFAQKTVADEIRMLASVILLETKPSLALISVLTELLLHETDLQVASFVYSQLRGIARSRLPDDHYLSTVCNIAVKILSQKLGRLSYRLSNALHYDWFRDDLLTGTSRVLYLLKNGTSVLPTEIISNGKLYFIGRVFQTLDLGVRAEGLNELFKDRPGIFKDFGVTDFAAIMKILSDWQSLPKNKPLLSVFLRLFGQEVSFFDLNQDFVQKVLKSVSLTANNDNIIWPLIQQLQKGISWHWTKSFLMFETRFVQPTCLGLPVEISKYYSTLPAITVNAKANIDPPPKESLQELLNTDVFVETDGFAGVAMDYFVFHGINTDLFQSGVQLTGKTTMSLPWRASFKKNFKEKNYEVTFPPCKKTTEFFKLKFNIYAVSRNIEDPSLAKMTPMIPERRDPEQRFTEKDSESSKDYQVGPLEIFQPKLKYCAELSSYGAAVCTDLEATRVQNLKDLPLYYFLGNTEFACQLQPVNPDKPVEKILIQISAGTHKHISHYSPGMNVNQEKSKETKKYTLIHRLKKIKGIDVTPDPVIIVKVLALNTNVNPLGYEAMVYYAPDTKKDEIEIIISEAAEEANWKICVDADIDKIQSGAMTRFKWGAECQSYEVAVKVSVKEESKPTIIAEMNWGNVPAFLQTFGQSVQQYFPGASYAWGFSQKHEKNTEREVSATLLPLAQGGFDLEVKIPELTVYRQGISYLFDCVGIKSEAICPA
ncbi:vitellogenin 3, phosvitinless isoform X1 [Tachysurus fulvidraco]|uniref:vitellogenin 3, phosvitinless isoform X1 n=1 Tax=Tachysurus fulvidraco TaxID=1234273 RepID=UPI000F508710|nr:vitellogenin 3, phosvitinless isoform X1 [Tachysurus fulvidraco]